jgi:hypothetical protein
MNHYGFEDEFENESGFVDFTKIEKWGYLSQELYEISCNRYGVDRSNARLLIAVMVQAGKDLNNTKLNTEDRASALEYLNSDMFADDCFTLALQPEFTRQVLVGDYANIRF